MEFLPGPDDAPVNLPTFLGPGVEDPWVTRSEPFHHLGLDFTEEEIAEFPFLCIQQSDCHEFRKSKEASKGSKFCGALNKNHIDLVIAFHIIMLSPKQLYNILSLDASYHSANTKEDTKEMAVICHRAGIPVFYYDNKQDWVDGNFVKVWNYGDEGFSDKILEEFFNDLHLLQDAYTERLDESMLDPHRNNRNDPHGFSGQNQQRRPKEHDGLYVATPQANKFTHVYVEFYRKISNLARSLGLPFVDLVLKDLERLETFARKLHKDNLYEAGVLGEYGNMLDDLLKLLFNHLDIGNAKQDGWNNQTVAGEFYKATSGEIRRRFGAAFNREACYLAINRITIMKGLVEKVKEELKDFPTSRMGISAATLADDVPRTAHSVFPDEVELLMPNLDKWATYTWFHDNITRMYEKIGRENLTNRRKLECIASTSQASAHDVVWKIYREWTRLDQDRFDEKAKGNLLMSFIQQMQETGGCAGGEAQRTMPHNTQDYTGLQVVNYLIALADLAQELNEFFDPTSKQKAESTMRDKWDSTIKKMSSSKVFLACGELTSQVVLKMLCDPIVGVVPNAPPVFLTYACIKAEGGPITFIKQALPEEDGYKITNLPILLQSFAMTMGVTPVTAEECFCQCSKANWRRYQMTEPRFKDRPIHYVAPVRLGTNGEVSDSDKCPYKFCEVTADDPNQWTLVNVDERRYNHVGPDLVKSHSSGSSQGVSIKDAQGFDWFAYWQTHESTHGLKSSIVLGSYKIKAHRKDNAAVADKPTPKRRNKRPTVVSNRQVRKIVRKVHVPTLVFRGEEVDGKVVCVEEERAINKWAGGSVTKYGSRPKEVIIRTFRERTTGKWCTSNKKKGRSSGKAKTGGVSTAPSTNKRSMELEGPQGYQVSLKRQLLTWQEKDLEVLLAALQSKKTKGFQSKGTLVAAVMESQMAKRRELNQLKCPELKAMVGKMGHHPPAYKTNCIHLVIQDLVQSHSPKLPSVHEGDEENCTTNSNSDFFTGPDVDLSTNGSDCSKSCSRSSSSTSIIVVDDEDSVTSQSTNASTDKKDDDEDSVSSQSTNGSTDEEDDESGDESDDESDDEDSVSSQSSNGSNDDEDDEYNEHESYDEDSVTSQSTNGCTEDVDAAGVSDHVLVEDVFVYKSTSKDPSEKEPAIWSGWMTRYKRTTRSQLQELPLLNDANLTWENQTHADICEVACKALELHHPHLSLSPPDLIKIIVTTKRKVPHQKSKLFEVTPNNEKFRKLAPFLSEKRPTGRSYLYKAKCQLHAAVIQDDYLLFHKKQDALNNVYLSIILHCMPQYFVDLLGDNLHSKFVYNNVTKMFFHSARPTFVVFRLKGKESGSTTGLYIGHCSDGYQTRQRITMYS